MAHIQLRLQGFVDSLRDEIAVIRAGEEPLFFCWHDEAAAFLARRVSVFSNFSTMGSSRSLQMRSG